MRSKGISRIIPLLFLGLVLLVLWSASYQSAGLSAITFHNPDQSWELTPSYSETDNCYCLYLPSFLSQEELTVSHPWYMRVRLTQELSAVPMKEPLTLTLSTLWGREQRFTLRLLRCSTDYTISLQAKDGTIAYLHQDRNHVREVFATILDRTGNSRHMGTAQLSGRGNSSWTSSRKKPYDLELSEKASFGPFEEIQKLCLMTDVSDLSKFNNSLAYRLGQLLDIPYASAYTYADLFINGEYYGLYGIATKQEYKKHMDSDGIQAVFELSATGKGQIYYTDTMGKEIRIYQGDPDHISYQTESIEEALLSRDWDTLFRHIDLDTWARKYAMDELLYSLDLSLSSQYFFVSREEKVYCMLPWDYDRILYSPLHPIDGTTSPVLSAYRNPVNWYGLLLEAPQFRTAVSEVLETAFTSELLSAMSEHLVRSQEEISGSWHCDSVLWYNADVMSADTQSRLDLYRLQYETYYTQRLSFLQDLFANWEDYCQVTCTLDLDGRRELNDLTLMLPIGTSLEPYRDRIPPSVPTPEGYVCTGWTTEEGYPLETVTTLTDNRLILVGHYLPQ